MKERVEQLPTLEKVKNLPRNQQCLKNPQYKCACFLSDETTRLATLKKLREELGIYSFINVFNDGLEGPYDQRKRQLCEGRTPTFPERVKGFFSRK